MEMLENFGFEPTFFVAQIVNFLILAFVFKKFLYKPLLKVLDDRKKAIAKGLKDAEKAEKQLMSADAQKEEIIKFATLEAEKIVDETKKTAISMREEILASSKVESDRIIAEAKLTAADQLEKARHEAADISIGLSKKVLDRVLSDFFTKEEKEKILKRNVSKLTETK